MICGRHGLRKKQYEDQYKDKHKDKYKDKYQNNRQTYDVICFWKGDDDRSLIMKNVQNMQNMQNMQKSKISQSSINSQTCLGHLVLLFEDWKCYFFNMVTCLVIKGSP